MPIADTTGTWQRWHAQSYLQRNSITIATPDRRIHGAGGPTTIGTQVQRWSTSGMAESRGLYYFSLYADIKWRSYRDTSYGFLADLPVKELDYIKAEAYIRLNQTQSALALLNANDYENAETEFRKVLQLDPGHNRARVPLANSLLAQAYGGNVPKMTEARQAYGAALPANPRDPELRFNYAFTLARTGDEEGALREYRKVVRLAPAFPPSLVALPQACSLPCVALQAAAAASPAEPRDAIRRLICSANAGSPARAASCASHRSR